MDKQNRWGGAELHSDLCTPDLSIQSHTLCLPLSLSLSLFLSPSLSVSLSHSCSLSLSHYLSLSVCSHLLLVVPFLALYSCSVSHLYSFLYHSGPGLMQT